MYWVYHMMNFWHEKRWGSKGGQERSGRLIPCCIFVLHDRAKCNTEHLFSAVVRMMVRSESIVFTGFL